MTELRPSAGRHFIVFAVVFGALAASLLLLALGGAGRAADRFTFDQELLLDARPMRPAKRVPILHVAPSGVATIDLWCKTVTGRVELFDQEIRIEPGALPDDMPAMMSQGQCTPARMQADQDLLALLAQVTAWRKQGGVVVLLGPQSLKFRASDH